MGCIERHDCPVCGAAALLRPRDLDHRRIARCSACRHEFAVRFDPERVAAAYAAAYYRDADDPRIEEWARAHAPVWDAVVDQIAALRPDLQSLLDVGAGTGGFLARVRARRPDVALAAVETSPAAREALRRRLPGVSLPVDDAEALGTSGIRCDVVTMLQTLEHLRDPLRVCRGVLQCLRPGGLLFTTVPNRRSLAVLRQGEQAPCYANGTHLQFFCARSLSRLLRAAGFTGARRLVAFGGGQHRGLFARTAQYALRWSGWSAELRCVAFRPAGCEDVR